MSHQNDTYGEVTAAEHADLRASARPCLTCGMLADVDPVFHESRYGHAPRVRDGGGVLVWSAGRFSWVADAARHDYGTGPCPHPDCGGGPGQAVSGYQAACCGHYYPRSRVFMDDDSEPYCRRGMGCQARRPARTTP
jgi:hypothetical protein